MINEIDVFTETQLSVHAENPSRSAELNHHRDELINRVEQTRRLNLAHLDANQDAYLSNENCSISELFARFCFVVKNEERLVLLVSDEFIPKNQMKLFKDLISDSNETNLVNRICELYELFKKGLLVDNPWF